MTTHNARHRGMRLLIIALVVLAGCDKSPKQDCGKYSAKYADTVGANPSRRITVMDGARRDCEAGRVDEKKFACVMSASTGVDIRRCEGLAPLGQ
jgi:hypothetical protein